MKERYEKRDVASRIREIIVGREEGGSVNLAALFSTEELEIILYALEPDTNSAPVAARPHIEKRGKWWVLCLPKKRDVRITKEGSLGGELLGVLVEHDKWGKDLSREHVMEELRKRVKNRAIQKEESTRKEPTIRQIKEALKDINQKLKKSGIRGIKLIETRTTLSVTWKYFLDFRPL